MQQLPLKDHPWSRLSIREAGRDWSSLKFSSWSLSPGIQGFLPQDPAFKMCLAWKESLLTTPYSGIESNQSSGAWPRVQAIVWWGGRTHHLARGNSFPHIPQKMAKEEKKKEKGKKEEEKGRRKRGEGGEGEGRREGGEEELK